MRAEAVAGNGEVERTDAGAAAGVGSVEALFRAHARFVWKTLHRMGVREADLPDLLQEVFVVVQRRIGEFEGRSKPTTWLFSIASHVASNHRRLARHRREALVDELPEREGRAEDSPEAGASRAESRRMLELALSTLGAEHRAVLVMFEIEGMSADEIASELGIPTGTVYSRLYHARRKFLEALPKEARR